MFRSVRYPPGNRMGFRYIAAIAGAPLPSRLPSTSRKGHGAVLKGSKKCVYAPAEYDFSKARLESELLIKEIQDKSKSPGVSVSVGVNGDIAWSEGFGLADVENKVACRPSSMMRIASISKPITMLLLAHLWDAGLVDLDAPVQTYVPRFPEKTVDGEAVAVTTRMLLYHIAGIRDYALGGEGEQDKTPLFSQKEFLITKHYNSVSESVDLFANDPLCHKPGSEYLYTTHGWTLVSAVIEGVGGRPFLKQLDDMLFHLGLPHIQAEHVDKLIPDRARYYQLDSKGQLVNAPYVDNSYKWAGGGLLATAEDIVHFGFKVLTSYFGKPIRPCDHPVSPRPCPKCAPYIKQGTVKEMWTAHPLSEGKERGRGYGMGWVVDPKPTSSAHDVAIVSHTGGAIGGTSALVVIPPGEKSHSVVVAVICNMENLSGPLEDTARLVGQAFLLEAVLQDEERMHRTKPERPLLSS